MKTIDNPIQEIKKYTDKGIHIAIVTCNKYSPEDWNGRFEGNFSEVGYINAVNEVNKTVDLVNGDPVGIFDPVYDDLVSIYEEDGNDWKLAEGEDARCRLLLEDEHYATKYAAVYALDSRDVESRIGTNILKLKDKKNLKLFDSALDAFNYAKQYQNWHPIEITYYDNSGDLANWSELDYQDVQNEIETEKRFPHD